MGHQNRGGWTTPRGPVKLASAFTAEAQADGRRSLVGGVNQAARTSDRAPLLP